MQKVWGPHRPEATLAWASLRECPLDRKADKLEIKGATDLADAPYMDDETRAAVGAMRRRSTVLQSAVLRA
jgi:hypothetical protein